MLLQQQQQFYLLSLQQLQRLKIELSLQRDPVLQQPLLIPIVFRLNPQQLTYWQQQKLSLLKLGLNFMKTSDSNVLR